MANWYAGSGVFVSVEDVPPLEIQQEVEVYLAYKGKRAALAPLGRALDACEITLDKAQAVLDTIVTGYTLDAIAKQYKGRWWQRSGWLGVLTRFGNTEIT